MKNPLLPALFILITSFHLSAQTNTNVTPYIDFTVAFSGQFNSGDENSVGSLTSDAGFFGSFSYGITMRQTTFLTTAYMKFHGSTNFDKYSEIWNSPEFTLDRFTTGELFSSGLMFGGMFATSDLGTLPRFYCFLQLGMCNTYVPDISLDYHSTDVDGNDQTYKSSYSASRALGSVIHLGVQADVFQSTNYSGNVKLGLLRERSDIPREYYTYIDADVKAGTEVFEWNAFSAYLGFSLSF